MENTGTKEITQMENTLIAISYKNNQLKILNQLLLPKTLLYEDCSLVELGFNAIKEMKVRGAPAIAITAALSLACELSTQQNLNTSLEVKNFIFEKLDFLCQSRPTAVNLFTMAETMKSLIQKEFINLNSGKEDSQKLKLIYISAAENLLKEDLENNILIGKHGANCFIDKENINILTHCNTGSLATSGYGTALGVIRTLHSQNKLAHVYATETRPFNQGARLTAFELVHERIPSTLITDSMAAFLMHEKKIDAVIVGADRIVKNGDTANKIGTYSLAIAAHYHNIPFYVAAPYTSIDLTKKTGKEIHIEERPAHELTHINNIQIAANGINVWNPSFDTTPAELITNIITEKGVLSKNSDRQFCIMNAEN